MPNDLKTFLNSKRAYNTAYNIVGMGEVYAGKYFLDAFSEGVFWDLYVNELKHASVSIAEKPLGQSIPRLDIDIKKNAGPDEFYTLEEIQILVKMSNDFFQKHIPSIPQRLLSCFVLEKEPNNNGKRGLHIQWPLFALPRSALVFWVSEIASETKKLKLFGVDDSIDAASCDVPWLLYGSVKPTARSKPYTISFALGSNLEVHDEEWLSSQIQLENSACQPNFSPSIHRLMSIQPNGREVLSFSTGTNHILQIVFSPHVEAKKSAPNNVSAASEDVAALVDMLDISKSFRYDTWWKVGSAIFTATSGSEEGFRIWDEWSQNCPEKYSEASVIVTWKRFKMTEYGAGILKKWAKDDNPDSYTRWKGDKLASIARSCTRGKFTSDKVALLCKEVMGDVFAYCHGIDKFYHFSEHRWLAYPEIIVQKILNENIKPQLLKCLRDGGTEAAEIEKIERMFEENFSLIGIYRMLSKRYAEIDDKCFTEKLDQNLDVIAFQNGVYNLDKCIFREGRPSDMVKAYLRCNYNENYNWDHEDVKAVQDILVTFFPITETREYMLDIMAHIFVGNKKFKNLFIWIGAGNNGKTVFYRWITKLLGPEYSVTVTTTLLSSTKSKPGSATPEMAQLRSKRVAIFNEPDYAEKLTNGNLKTLTGRDEVSGRFLYERQPSVFVPIAIYILICNHEPKLANPEDQATWSRFRVCEFPSTFVEPHLAPKTRKEQIEKRTFPQNPEFQDIVFKYVDALAWVLIERWKRVKNVCVNAPEIVTRATRKYQENSDILLQFLNSKLRVNTESSVNFSDFAMRYKTVREEMLRPPVEKSKLMEDLAKANFQIVDGQIVGLEWNLS